MIACPYPIEIVYTPPAILSVGKETVWDSSYFYSELRRVETAASKFSCSAEQQHGAKQLVQLLVPHAIRRGINLMVEPTIEKEVLFAHKSKEGLSMIVLDYYGDIMTSFNGHDGDLRVRHYDYDQLDQVIGQVLEDFVHA